MVQSRRKHLQAGSPRYGRVEVRVTIKAAGTLSRMFTYRLHTRVRGGGILVGYESTTVLDLGITPAGRFPFLEPPACPGERNTGCSDTAPWRSSHRAPRATVYCAGGRRPGAAGGGRS